MRFNCFDCVKVEPRIGISPFFLLKEMRILSAKSGLPVIAKINGEIFKITSSTNINAVLSSLKSK